MSDFSLGLIGVATRDEQTASSFAGVVCLAAARDRLKLLKPN
ncbi:hypothetical protein ACRAWG_19055 [Methylobacterium sp. P31]